MLSFGESLAIVVVTVAGALLFVLALNRVWPAEKRRNHNDLIGWHLSILGTTYAVILGFMLYTVWTNYGAADLNVDAEANALINVYRMADGLPQPQAAEMKRLAQAYADEVVQRDWPQMAEGEVPEASHASNARMWKTLTSVKTASPTESTAQGHSLTELANLAQHRRMRLLQSASRLPGVLWCVLIVGEVLTIASASMFGSVNLGLHVMQVFAFALLISLVLVAIADIDRPFQGGIHVSKYAFERVRHTMREEQ